ncbi:hypothetical protein M011DRAFT_338471 [Sporormia fimetaria CBS 119925]|uniref:Scaffold protein Scd2 n=1 Tax=Sporormia fimetaria CBS 119925 TaxID=1340428 RepID=A0A6A6VHX4_9PLEO|nr:hypothetical protein M011DRAFT_338471 [Sporormia fimetaria CBS 119925]
MKFRRSMKGEKDTRPHHISIPPKDAIAIVPPKKVIRALYDYQAPESAPGVRYLSFSQGDFLHVVGRENDKDWYEACNPLHGKPGLVPVSYFEPVGKTVRDSGGSTKSANGAPPAAPPFVAPHDSGYGERGIPSPNNPTDLARPSTRMSKSMGKGSGAMVYGVVMYDFKAERPDELEAKEGEAIIVIAQSNPEWFVAKPITRLGGPGLIPVSFIEIRDMTTGQAVPDAQEAVDRAGVPRVEEWKRMAADYKNGSIPLGKLEQNSQQTLQQGMERMSLSSKSSAPIGANGGFARGSTVCGESYAFRPCLTLPQHSRNASAYQIPQSQAPDATLLAPVRAAVTRYCFADEIFWFIVECQMEDGRHWELQRLYQDFYDLQIQLIATFPVEAGTSGQGERTLPYMPGPVTYVTDNISNGRRRDLDEYIRNLLKLGKHITHGTLVKRFFSPRQGDYEIDPEIAAAQEYRMSHTSGRSSEPSQSASRQSSADQLQATTPQTPYSTATSYASHQRGLSQQGYGGLNVPPPLQQQNSNVSATSTGTGLGSALKIKVWFEEDSCVVIRMPTSLKFADLYAKLKERRALEKPDENFDGELAVDYRDEHEGKYYPIMDDEDLAIAVERNSKLNLYVRTKDEE